MAARGSARSAAERTEALPLAEPSPWHTAPMTQLPNLRVSVCADVPRAVVQLDGELDVASRDLLVGHLSDLVSQGYTHIVIDLAHLAFCDAAGLGAFARVSRLAAARGGWLRIAAAPPRMARIMRLARLTSMLPGYETAQDAFAD